jgi:hypothetical protein
LEQFERRVYLKIKSVNANATSCPSDYVILEKTYPWENNFDLKAAEFMFCSYARDYIDLLLYSLDNEVNPDTLQRHLKKIKLNLITELTTYDTQEKVTKLILLTRNIDLEDNFTFRIEISPRFIMFSDFCIIADYSSYYNQYFGRILTKDAIKIATMLRTLKSK